MAILNPQYRSAEDAREPIGRPNQVESDEGETKARKKGDVVHGERTGWQPGIKFCPHCRADLRKVHRDQMRTKAYRRKDGPVAESIHTYQCLICKNRFEISQKPKTR